MNPETLCRLNPKTSDMEFTSPATGERLTTSQIAACMRRLLDYEYALLMFINAGLNFTKHCREWQELKDAMYESAEMKITEKNLETTSKLADIVIQVQAVRVNCFTCGGIGQIGTVICQDCMGSGIMRVDEHHVRKSAGIDKSNWKNIWRDRYHNLGAAFYHVKGRAERKVREND